jgi:hypothetical protein
MMLRRRIGRRRVALWPAALLLAALTALPGVCRASGGDDSLRLLCICDFEQPAGFLNPGGEYPGAKGSFTIAAEAARSGRSGGRISFDLRRGVYMAWGLDLRTPLSEGARTVAIWVRPSLSGLRIHLKTRDATGQEHIRVLSAPPAGQWAQLTFGLLRIEGHWAGANDGKIHWPITYVQIGVEAPGAEKVGTMDMDDLAIATSASRSSTPGLAVDVGWYRVPSARWVHEAAPARDRGAVHACASGSFGRRATSRHSRRMPQHFAGFRAPLDRWASRLTFGFILTCRWTSSART